MDGLHDGRIIGTGEQFVGAQQAGQAGHIGPEGVEKLRCVIEGKIRLGFDRLDKAADEDAHEGDLIPQPVAEGGFEVGELNLRKLLRIEAVFEGVGVAWLRASGAFGHGEVWGVWALVNVNI